MVSIQTDLVILHVASLYLEDVLLDIPNGLEQEADDEHDEPGNVSSRKRRVHLCRVQESHR